MNVLEQAAELIENGWCKADLINDGKVCALGAITAVVKGINVNDIKSITEDQHWEIERAAYDDEMNEHPAVKAIADEIIEKHPHYKPNTENSYTNYISEVVYTFNDDQSSAEPVLEMFKYAAKRLDDNS